MSQAHDCLHMGGAHSYGSTDNMAVIETHDIQCGISKEIYHSKNASLETTCTLMLRVSNLRQP